MQLLSTTLFVVAFIVATTVGQEVVPLDQRCLGCICQAVSDCNTNAKCDGATCGLFRITWAYWADSGKPTQDGQGPEDQEAYPNCVNEPYCAARSVQGYMNRFGKDCNQDGRIDCLDYAIIHKLGGYGCVGGQVTGAYAEKLNQCLIQTG